jgi:hypothetical protein
VQGPESDQYEDIYQSVISPQRSKLNLSFSRRNKREYPIREFLETEEKYLGKSRTHFPLLALCSCQNLGSLKFIKSKGMLRPVTSQLSKVLVFIDFMKC